MKETYQQPQRELDKRLRDEGRVLGENQTNWAKDPLLTRRRLIGIFTGVGVAAAGSLLGLKAMGSFEADAETPRGETGTSQEIEDPLAAASYLTYEFKGLGDGTTNFEDFDAKYQLQDGEYGQQFLDAWKLVANYQATDDEYAIWEQHAKAVATATGESYQEGDGAKLFGKEFLTPLLKGTYAINRDVPGIRELYPVEEFFDKFVAPFVAEAQYNRYITRTRGMEPYQIEDISFLSEYYQKYDMAIYSNQATLWVKATDNSHLNSMGKVPPYYAFTIDAGYDDSTGKFGMSEVKFKEVNISDVEEHLGYRPE